MSESQTDRMTRAIGIWIARLESYPGWKEWKRKHLVHTLHFDEMRQPLVDEPKDDFRFSDEVEKQHAVVIKFLALQETIRALKECEFYFRRYPFRGLPVTRHSHITNVCEMYFGRFYEFKERLKNYFDALASAVPEHHLDIGKFIKLFERSFGQELRARNHIHHHNRFEDVAIDRVLLMDSFSTVREDGG